MLNVPPTAKAIWRRGHGLRVSADKLHESKIKLRTLGHKASDLSTTAYTIADPTKYCSLLLSLLKQSTFIGVAAITHNTHVHNKKNVHIEGRLPKVKMLFSLTIMEFSERKEFASSGSQFLPLSEVTILKRDTNEEITAHFSCLPLMCVNSLVIWLRP